MKRCSVALAVLLASCAPKSENSPVVSPSFDAIDSASMLNEIKTLSSDEFEGRKPGSAGEAKTIAYMEKQFRNIGLKPGNPNGTYLQNVPLAGIVSRPELNFTVKGHRFPL